MEEMQVSEALTELDLSHDFTEKQVDQAYKQHARRYHPDRNPGGDEKMARLNQARGFFDANLLLTRDK